MIADEALKNASVVAIFAGRLNDRQQHREAALRAIVRRKRRFRWIGSVGLGHGARIPEPSNND